MHLYNDLFNLSTQLVMSFAFSLCCNFSLDGQFSVNTISAISVLVSVSRITRQQTQRVELLHL